MHVRSRDAIGLLVDGRSDKSLRRVRELCSSALASATRAGDPRHDGPKLWVAVPSLVLPRKSRLRNTSPLTPIDAEAVLELHPIGMRSA